ncbi:MAG TPA: hypothetical protein VFS21_13555 [Roseiflexaceae bacterium]|nr:hypothetical protein [Roseiflexaceae bacterium]
MQHRRQALIERANLIVLAAMSAGWGSAVVLFWLQVLGPLRPTGAPAAPLPSAAGALFWFAVCFAPRAFPPGYFRPRPWEMRLYERLGVLVFRRFATNGDLINGWVRRHDPAYRILRGRASLHAYVAGTVQGEVGHSVLLLLGLITAVYAARIGWTGWAAYLAGTNILFNLYPILLQRYTRARLALITGRFEA